ncbi:MAG: HDOD domain-containing protein [Planctomycetota bacterium]
MSAKNIVVVFLTNNQRAESVAEAIGSGRIRTMVAKSSDEFYEILNFNHVDLVIIENQLRGFLSGLDILGRLYRDLLRPTTTLIANPTNRIRERAQCLGIDTVLAPETPISTIRTVLETQLTKGRISQVHICAPARRLVQQFGDIPPMPQVLVKAVSYLNFDECDVNIPQFCDDISVDPKVTAQIFNLINSSAMGFNRKYTNLQQAVNLLGVRRTVSLIVSSTAVENSEKLAHQVHPVDRLWYNRRSVLIANAASSFARLVANVSSDTAFVLGLLQDIGILLLANAIGGKYYNIIRRVRETGALRLDVVERQEFGMTHSDVSAALLQVWEMPSSLVTMVLTHHDASNAENRSKTEQRFLNVMRVGEALADFADGHTSQRFPLLQRLLHGYGGAMSEECQACIAKAVSKAVESSRLFSLPVPNDDVLTRLVHRVSASEIANIPPVDTEEVPNLEEPAVADLAEDSTEPELSPSTDRPRRRRASDRRNDSSPLGRRRIGRTSLR